MVEQNVDESAAYSGIYSCLMVDPKCMGLVTKRVKEKIDSYETYNFTPLQSVALNIFFDLAQEYTGIEEVYALCVTIPKHLFELDCNLYVLDHQAGALIRCGTKRECDQRAPMPFPLQPEEREGHFLIPIRGNHELVVQLPSVPMAEIIGVLDIYPVQSLSEHEKLFFTRYANRIGFHLHNRIISQKNREHIQFISSLVKDIGHNVIVPNMFFKLYYRRLEARIKVLKNFGAKIDSLLEMCPAESPEFREAGRLIQDEMRYIQESILDQYRQIYSHYQNTSLFLETLLRRSHFEEGRYVLEKRPCNFKSLIIDPQVERFAARFEARGIEIDTSMGGVPDEEVEVVADVGLISQVYSNLFSNAVKYAREVSDKGRQRKFISYGLEIKKDFFGPGRDGVKLNVFSSGPAIPPEEARGLFAEGFRGGNSQGEYGTGHGLYFISEVVRLHGGVVGFEPTPLGNNFFFILPHDSDFAPAVEAAQAQTPPDPD